MMPVPMFMILLFLLPGSAWAESESAGIPWSQLGQDEQQVLQRFNQQWDQFPPERQERLRNGARQWSNMNADERDQARQRFQQWQQMQPDDQRRLRERFDRFRRLPPEQRQAMRNARQWFRSLPQKRRQAMREQWKNMSPGERREFRRQLRKEYRGDSGNQPPGQGGAGGDRPLHPRPLPPAR